MSVPPATSGISNSTRASRAPALRPMKIPRFVFFLCICLFALGLLLRAPLEDKDNLHHFQQTVYWRRSGTMRILFLAVCALWLLPGAVAQSVDGKAQFHERCAGCHGDDGTGAGRGNSI